MKCYFFLSMKEKCRTAARRTACLFAFTKGDRRAMSLLLILLAGTVVLRASAVVKPAKMWWASAEETEILAQLPQNEERALPQRDTASRSARYTPPSYMQKKKFSVDLNVADTFDLQEIRGIGSVYAKRIVAHREKLGGFVHVEQLREVWGIDSLTYSRMLPSVYIASPVLRKINLNQADIKTLKNHPYLDYYQAKEIYLHRMRYGDFRSVDEVRDVNLMDAETFARVKPYLCVE
ncbi:MAG: helix-hairpin-helix domain-containing protein [Bacteroidales bacterium]|nr:helix-hairpin-helix domain-containing protein [Bacteroidales bacterium]